MLKASLYGVDSDDTRSSQAKKNYAVNAVTYQRRSYLNYFYL